MKTALIALPLLLAMWIGVHPYFGIIGDGWLYSAQALHQLFPAHYADDLFFKYGSQDSFTAFTRLYAPLVAAVGLPTADFLATAAGQFVWFGGMLFLVRTLFRRDAEFLAAAAAVILLNHGYGGSDVFVYSEYFLSPRPYAEGLTLVAVALALRRRPVASTAALLVAALLHPLMALGGAAVLGLRWAVKDRRAWALILAGLAVGLALALANVGPFGRAFQTFDAGWYGVVRHRCSDCLVSRWPWWDFLQIAAMLFIVGVGGVLKLIGDRLLTVSVVAVSLGSLIVAFVGGDLLRNILVVQLQVWRALWIAAVLANAFIGVLLIRLRARGLSVAFLAIAAALSGFSQFFEMLKLIAPVVMATACAILALELKRGAPLKGAIRVLLVTLFGLTCALAVMAAQYDLLRPGLGTLVGQMSRVPILADSLIALYALAGLIALVRRGAHLALGLTGVAALTASAVLADVRPGWEVYAASPEVSPSLRDFAPEKGTVYWEGHDGLEILWFKLRRPDYYSCTQGSGIVFNRETALEYERRGRALSRLNTEDFDDGAGTVCGSKAEPYTYGPSTRARIAAACRALPDLDTLILNTGVPGAWSKAWTAPVPEIYYRANGQTDRVSTFYRYDCAELR